MLNLEKVAITGTLGAGKSTALKQFKKLGAYTLDCDEYVHELIASNQNIIYQLRRKIGEQIITHSAIDRKKMSDIVFEDHSLLHKLQTLLFPEIKKWLLKEYKEALQSMQKLFVAEVPLLFEAGWQKDFDWVLCISVTHAICEKRLTLGKEEFRRRDKFHTSNKKQLSDFIIKNDADPIQMEEKIKKLYFQLTSKQKRNYDSSEQ